MMITKFKIEQIDDIMKIWLNVNSLAHHFIPKDYWYKHYDDVKKMLPAAEVFNYQTDGVIKGFIGIAEKHYIAGIFVEEKWQSNGIGKQLLDYVKTLYDHLALDCYDKNRRAISFYQRNDFVITDKHINQSDGELEYYMQWEKSGI